MMSEEWCDWESSVICSYTHEELMATATLEMGASKRRRVLWGTQSNEAVVSSSREIDSALSPFSMRSTYQQEWEERRNKTPVHVDVTGLASCEGFLVACTSLGEVFIWQDHGDTNFEPNTNFDSSTARLSGSSLQSTVRHYKVSSLPLHSIQISDPKNHQDRMILVGGKEGIWTIPLKDPLSSQATKWKTNTGSVRQILVDLERVFVLSEQGEVSLFELAGNTLVNAIDLNGSLATTMALANTDESLADNEDDDDSPPSMNVPTNSRSLLIGTSDSKILLWTATTSGFKVESIGLHEPDQSKSESTTGCTGSLPFDIAVTALHCTDDNWWILAGVCRNKKSSNRNILATLHGTTRTLISHKVVRETIHGIYNPNQSSSRLYTIANEGVVSVWDSPYRLELMQRLWSSPPSGRAMVKVGSTRVVMAGIGPKMDVFENDCRIQSLLVDDATTTSSSS
jgi:hypothetical protein